MLFSSVSFFTLFLPFLLLFYFAVPQRFREARNLILLLFGLFFYSYGGISYLGLMLVSILINYCFGLLASSPRYKKPGLVLGIILNLALLGYFKYAGFFSGILHTLSDSVPILSVTLPIGISFYTFQGLSYVIDVYRGDALPEKNPLKVALYISLFPQLIAGPIVRYVTVAEAIRVRHETLDGFAEGLRRFMLGFGKKMLLANAAAEIADAVFAMPESQLSASVAWLGALAYTAQIYFDFSAYSDMAIGIGKMFEFHFLENFNYPYISQSVTEFWRRWHISLSSWFRDYVYIPLGGNRCKWPRHILNLAVVWLLTGLWHGAAWTFVLWGAYFGALLILEKYLWGNLLKKAPRVLRHLYTIVLVVVSWVIFRADSVEHAWTFLRCMFGFGTGGWLSGESVYYLLQYWPEWILFILGSMPIAKWAKDRLAKKETFFSVAAPYLFALCVFALGYMKLVSNSFNPFIYFRF